LAIPDERAEIAGIFEDFLDHLDDFCWYVSAIPVSAADEALQDIDLDLAYSRGREAMSGQHAVAAERQLARYRELSGRVGGLWRVRVAADSVATAAMLGSGADASLAGYRLSVGDSGVDVDALPGELTGGTLLAAIARPPVREIPGIRVVERAAFDVTPEISGEVSLGVVTDVSGAEFGPLSVSLESLNRHAFVAGATGAGKSQTIRHILEQLPVPWLVIEPAKAEYSGMAGRLGDSAAVAVIRPGDPDAVPLSLNPLQPEPGFPLQTHVDLVRALFLAAFEAAEPFPQVLAQALSRCYAEAGWDVTTGTAIYQGAEYPSLGELQRVAQSVVDDIGYGPELASDVRGFIDVRLGSMRLGSAGRFLDGGYPLDTAELLSRNVVLELEGIGDDQDKAFCMGLVLIRVIEHLRLAGSAFSLRNVVVIEEAHRLLKASAVGTPAAHSVELFASLLAEIRAYGVGIVVAEQIPSKIVPDVVKNTAIKLMARLPAADDRSTVGAAMNLDEAQSRAVVSLPPGRIAVFADGMDRPVLVSVPLGLARENALPALGRLSVDGLTLREIAAAERIAARPEMILWIELLTVAHLTGVSRPTFRMDASEIATHAVRLLVRNAVSARRASIWDFCSPGLLQEHLVDVALGQSCSPGDEVCWQAGRFRWVDVMYELDEFSGSRTEPHPDSAHWAERGLVLPGSVDEQLQLVGRHPTLRSDDRALVLGSGGRSAIEMALNGLGVDPRDAGAADRLFDELGWSAGWIRGYVSAYLS
jgi:DNA helicase HerA-like ATPase